MKIENGLLFVRYIEILADDPVVYEAEAFEACIPVRNISHLSEYRSSRSRSLFTAINLNNKDRLLVGASIPDLLQLINEADAMNLVGAIGLSKQDLKQVLNVVLAGKG